MVQEAKNGPDVSVLPEWTIRNTWPGELKLLSVEGIRVPFIHYAGVRKESMDQKAVREAMNILKTVFGEEQ